MENGNDRALLALSDLELGSYARIFSVEARGELKRRLTELGYFPGERVKKVLKSPLGDPSAYLVRGSVTAIRERDAQAVLVTQITGEDGQST